MVGDASFIDVSHSGICGVTTALLLESARHIICPPLTVRPALHDRSVTLQAYKVILECKLSPEVLVTLQGVKHSVSLYE